VRLVFFLLGAPLVAGCGVPAVTFYSADASEDRTASSGFDARPGADTANEADAASEADATETDAKGDSDAAGQDDASTAADAPRDASAGDSAPAYCVGPDGGVPPPHGLSCCPGGQGKACAGECLPAACAACGPCQWPSGVCCTNTGAIGVCKPYC
jgi:hypothetical protein